MTDCRICAKHWGSHEPQHPFSVLSVTGLLLTWWKGRADRQWGWPESALDGNDGGIRHGPPGFGCTPPPKLAASVHIVGVACAIGSSKLSCAGSTCSGLYPATRRHAAHSQCRSTALRQGLNDAPRFAQGKGPSGAHLFTNRPPRYRLFTMWGWAGGSRRG